MLSHAIHTTNDSIKAEVALEIVKAFTGANTDSALWYANDFLNYFRKKEYKYGIAVMNSAIANINYTENNFDLAKSLYQESLALFKELGKTKQAAAVNSHLGIIEGRKGNLKLANVKFMETLQMYESLHDSFGMSDTYLNLGAANEINDDLDNALEYYKRASEYLSRDTSANLYATLLNNIGILYAKKNNSATALSYFNRSLALCRDSSFNNLKIAVLLDFGLCYADLQNKEKALAYFTQALDLAGQQQIEEQQAKILKGMASLFVATKPTKAVEYLQQAVTIEKKIGTLKLLFDTYGDLVATYKGQGKYKEALEYEEKMQVINDSINARDRASELANMHAIFELQKSRERVKQLIFLIRKNTVKRNIILIAAFCNLIVLIILAFSYQKSILLNKQLVKQTAELSEANEIKDKLFSIIGHDLRGPIGNIPVLLELMGDEDIDKEEKEYFYSSIKELAVGCKETLDKLLYWGKLNIKGNRLNTQTFVAKEHIENCLKLLRSLAAHKNITLFDETNKDVRIHADSEHFEFVMRNLLSNAIKFSYNGGKVIVRSEPASDQGFTLFSVTDSGKGIDTAKIPTIFEAIEKSGTGTAQEKGTNIGLKLCKDFIQENGGKIWVTSELNKGTTFYFTLKNA